MNMEKRDLNSSKDWSHCISSSNQNSRSSSDWSSWERSDRVGNSPKDGHCSDWEIVQTAETRIPRSETFSGSNCSGPSVRLPEEDIWGQSSGDIGKTADARMVNVGSSGYDLPQQSVGHPQNDNWNQICRYSTNSWNASEDTSRGWGGKQSWDIEPKGCQGQDAIPSESHTKPTTSPIDKWTNSRNESEDPGNGWGGNQSWSHGKGCSESKSPTVSPHDNWKRDSCGSSGRKDCGFKVPSRLCRDFSSGRCRWGSRCKFLHDDSVGSTSMGSEAGPSKCRDLGGDRAENSDSHDLQKDIKSLTHRRATTMCRDYAAGKCRRGSSCRFLHGDRGDRAEHNVRTDNDDKHDSIMPEAGRLNQSWDRGSEAEFGRSPSCKNDAGWPDVAASVKTTGCWGSRGSGKSNASNGSTSGEFVKDKWVETLTGSEDAARREKASGRDKQSSSNSGGENEGFASKFIKSQTGGTLDSFPVSVPTNLHAIYEAMQELNGRIGEGSKLIPAATASGFTGSCTYDVSMMSFKRDRIEDANLCNEPNTLATDAFNYPLNVKHTKQDNRSVRKEHVFPRSVGDVHTQGSEGHPKDKKQYVSHTSEVHKSLENERENSFVHALKPRDLVAEEREQMHELCEGSADVRNSSQVEKECVMFKMALVEFVKDILKPTWKEGKMSREVHKVIVKKVVDKVIGSVPISQAPKNRGQVEQYMSFCKAKLSKLVQDYVKRYLKPC